MIPILVLAAAYLAGSIPSGYLLVKWRTGADVRSTGSGNIGATNVLRAAGVLEAVLVLTFDIAKGYGAVWFAGQMTGQSPGWMSGAALAVMAGHAFPVFLGFRGGKSMASFVGAFLCLTPLAMSAALLVFLLTVSITRYVSLGSVFSAGSLPLAAWLISHPPGIVLLVTIVGAVFVVLRHQENLARVKEGSEPAFCLPGRKSL